jgi:hypothetical protein
VADPRWHRGSRLDRQATSISLLVVRRHGQKVLLAAKSIGKGTANVLWAVLDDGSPRSADAAPAARWRCAARR